MHVPWQPVSSSPRTPRPTRALVGLLAGAALVSACGGAAESVERTAPTATPTSAAPSPSPSPVPPPPPPPPAPPAVDPLDGAGPIPTSSVVAVKIDNSVLARPYHRGLGEASIVYQEVMEGGATRFLAVYAPAIGSEVGPIRSIRESDVELLLQYGKVPLAASGANVGVLATIRKAEEIGQVLDVNYESVPGPYRKGERRKDAINFYAAPAAIDAAKPGGSWPRDIGLTFGPLAPEAGSPAARASVSFSQIARTTVEHDPATGRYAVYSEGDRLNGAAPANVVVQHVQVRQSPYVDVLGNRTPYTETVGTGPVDVLREGRRVSGTWVRHDPLGGTRLLDDKGLDLPLAPGPTWFLLVPAGRSLDVG